MKTAAVISGLQTLAGLVAYLLQGGFGVGHGPLDGLFFAVQLPGVFGMAAAAVLRVRPVVLNVFVMFAVPFGVNCLWWCLVARVIQGFRKWIR